MLDGKWNYLNFINERGGVLLGWFVIFIICCTRIVFFSKRNFSPPRPLLFCKKAYLFWNSINLHLFHFVKKVYDLLVLFKGKSPTSSGVPFIIFIVSSNTFRFPITFHLANLEFLQFLNFFIIFRNLLD